MRRIKLLPPGKAMRTMADVQVALLRADSVLSMMHQGGAEIDLLSDLCYALGCVIGVRVQEVRYGRVDARDAFKRLKGAGYSPGLSLAMAFGLFCCDDDDTAALEIMNAMDDEDKADAARFALLSPRTAMDSFCPVAQWATQYATRQFQGPMEVDDMVHVAGMTFTRLDGARLPRMVIGPISYVDYTPCVTQTEPDNKIAPLLKRLPILPVLEDGQSTDHQLDMLCKTPDQRKALMEMHTMWTMTFDCAEFLAMLPCPPISNPTFETPWTGNATILMRLAISISRRVGAKALKMGCKVKACERGWTRKVRHDGAVPRAFSEARIDIDPSITKTPVDQEEEDDRDKDQDKDKDDTALKLLSMLKANIESDNLLADEAFSEMLTIAWHVHREALKAGKEAGPDDVYPVIFSCVDMAGLSPSVCAYVVMNCGMPRNETRQCIAGLQLARIGVDMDLI